MALASLLLGWVALGCGVLCRSVCGDVVDEAFHGGPRGVPRGGVEERINPADGDGCGPVKRASTLRHDTRPSDVVIPNNVWAAAHACEQVIEKCAGRRVCPAIIPRWQVRDNHTHAVALVHIKTRLGRVEQRALHEKADLKVLVAEAWVCQ